MAYWIDLQIEEPRYYVVNQHTGYRVRITVVDSDGLPVIPEEPAATNKIFAYLGVPISHQSPVSQGEFSHVCSYEQLFSFPPGTPLVNANPPWYRSDVYDQVLPSRLIAEQAIKDIKDAVARLLETCQVNDDMVVMEVATIGEKPVASSSSSSSSSGA